MIFARRANIFRKFAPKVPKISIFSYIFRTSKISQTTPSPVRFRPKLQNHPFPYFPYVLSRWPLKNLRAANCLILCQFYVNYYLIAAKDLIVTKDFPCEFHGVTTSNSIIVHMITFYAKFLKSDQF